MVKKLIGKIVVALIKAFIRAFIGMFVGIALVGFVLIISLFFGVLIPEIQGEGMMIELLGLLLIGAGIGAVVGFFDMMDFGSKVSEQHKPKINTNNSWQNRNEERL
jgi:predicted lipid-binding transport protein (Tim44 family)